MTLQLFLTGFLSAGGLRGILSLFSIHQSAHVRTGVHAEVMYLTCAET